MLLKLSSATKIDYSGPIAPGTPGRRTVACRARIQFLAVLRSQAAALDLAMNSI
ncbi:MAG: hypothetical protein PHN90_03200 [Methanothrix sp.]|nr:hypothetical protein [Methanothrix sp.]